MCELTMARRLLLKDALMVSNSLIDRILASLGCSASEKVRNALYAEYKLWIDAVANGSSCVAPAKLEERLRKIAVSVVTEDFEASIAVPCVVEKKFRI